MKRLIALTCAAALAVSAVAFGASKSYSGEGVDDPEATVAFKLGGDKVKHFVANNLEVSTDIDPSCLASGRTPPLELTKSLHVNDHGRFHGHGSTVPAAMKRRGPDNYTMKVSGQIRNKGKVTGQVSVTFSPLNCTSRVTDWEAHKAV